MKCIAGTKEPSPTFLPSTLRQGGGILQELRLQLLLGQFLPAKQVAFHLLAPMVPFKLDAASHGSYVTVLPALPPKWKTFCKRWKEAPVSQKLPTLVDLNMIKRFAKALVQHQLLILTAHLANRCTYIPADVLASYDLAEHPTHQGPTSNWAAFTCSSGRSRQKQHMDSKAVPEGAALLSPSWLRAAVHF